MLRHQGTRRWVWAGLGVAACLNMQALQAQSKAPSKAQAPKVPTFVWSAQVIAVDQPAKTVTVRVPFKEHVARYITQFKPGDPIVITWGSPKTGETDAIIYVTARDTSKRDHPDDFGYVLPGEFVSADVAARTVTLKAHLDPQASLKFASVKADQWIKATSPFDQSKPTAAITAVQPSTPPAPTPAPSKEPAPTS